MVLIMLLVPEVFDFSCLRLSACFLCLFSADGVSTKFLDSFQTSFSVPHDE